MYNCYCDCRYMTIVTTACLTGMNIKNMVSPAYGQTQRYFCMGYVLYQLIIFVVIGLSYTKKYGVELSQYALVMLFFRLDFRMMDLENTKSQTERLHWDLKMLSFTSFQWWAFGFFVVTFNRRKRILKVLVPLAMISSFICSFIGIYKKEKFQFKISLLWNFIVFA